MTPQSITYSANGACATFGFDFPIFEPADLEVLLNGAVQSSGFTLLGAFSPEGGAVRFAAAPAAGTSVTLRRTGKVQVSGSDAPGFLEAKILAGAHITVTKTSDAAGEHLSIATDINPAAFATAEQGAKADTALQPSAIGTSVQAYSAKLDWVSTQLSDAGKALIDDADAAAQRATLGLAAVASSGAYSDLTGTPPLGSAATHPDTDFASTIQGAKADTALQPSAIGVSVQAHDANLDWAAANLSSAGRALIDDLDASAQRATLGLAAVASSGSYTDLSNKPPLGSAAAHADSDFATAAQGAKADTALQPSAIGTTMQTYSPKLDWVSAHLSDAGKALIDDLDASAQRATLGLAAVASSGAYSDLTGKPSLGSAATHAVTDFATTTQGAKADTALQPSAIGISVQAYNANTVSGPGSSVANQIPQWSGSDGKTLKAGLTVGTGPGNLPQLDGSGKLPAAAMPAESGKVKVDATLAANYLENQFQPTGNHIAITKVDGKMRVDVTGLGSSAGKDIDTSTTLGANSDDLIPSQKAVKTYVDGMISSQVIPSQDRNMLNALGLMVASPQVSCALPEGYRWKLSSDEWSMNSANYTFAAGSPGAYSNQMPSYGSNIAASANHIGNITGVYTYIYDGANSIDYGIHAPTPSKSNNYYIGQDFGAGNTKHIRRIGLGQANWLRDIQVVKIQNADTPTGPWSDVYTTSSLPNHGTNTIDYIDLPASSTKRCWRILQNEDQPDGYGWMITELQMFEANTAGTMTLVTPAVTASAIPASAAILFLWKDDCGSAVVGTDLTVELSRDGGINWKSATITYQEPFDGAFSVYTAGIGLSDQPNGTAVKARIKALNGKSQRIGPAILTLR